MSWLFGKQIDGQQAHQRNAIVLEHRNAVIAAIKALQWLAAEMVAVRGHDSDHGKFLSLYRLLAEFDPSAKAYLDKLQAIRSQQLSRKPSINILSPRNVRRLLDIMKTKTVQRIVSSMKEQGVCSIINDGTQDLSKLEASCLLIRYIENDANGRPRPVERLVGLFTTGSTTGETLCDKILSHLENVDIPVSHIVGQSYDGAGNMAGKFKGLQAKVKEIQPKALYVWCSAHRLNLVIESVVTCCAGIRNTIGILQELYTFFGSHRRHEVLVKLQSEERYKRALKRVSNTTRSWRSVEDGCTTLLECFKPVVTALEQLRDDSEDPTTVSTARGLYVRVNEFDVVLSLHILKSIFQVTGPVSRILQSKASDLAISTHLITSCIEKLQQTRQDDSSWEKLLETAQNFSAHHNLATTLPQKRVTKTPRRPGEITTDERQTNPEQAFKTEVYNFCFDTVIRQMKSRFTDTVLTAFQQMSYFTHSGLLRLEDTNENDVKDLCKNYELDCTSVIGELNEFRAAYRSVHNMVDVSDLVEDKRTVNKGENALLKHGTETAAVDSDDESDIGDEAGEEDGTVFPKDVSEVITRNSDKWIDHSFIKPLRLLTEISSYPHLAVIYKILTSLAVTSASAERALSRVRIIKNRLRTSMADDWFSALTILASEQDIMQNISIDEIVTSFSHCSNRLRNYLT